MLPLYAEAKTFKPNASSNQGLWWTRFFDRYAVEFAKPEDTGKSGFIRQFASQLCGDGVAIQGMAKRAQSLIEKLEGEVRSFVTAGRFATGMGNDHPTENGFTWHHTLGAPYLPASSVKGLVRGWIEWNGDEHPHSAQLNNWFGSQSKSLVSEQAGWFVFFDALPTEAVQLAADVMTPHYADWYEQGGKIKSLDEAKVVPADWQSPVPITFLTVQKATFQFGVALRCGLLPQDKETAQAALPEVMALLEEALEWAGAGAKTAVGYGRFKLDPRSKLDAEKRQQQLAAQRLAEQQLQAQQAAAEQEAARIAQLDPLDQKLEVELRKPEYKNLPVWQATLNALLKDVLWQPLEREKLAQQVMQMLQQENVWMPDENSKRGERCRKVALLLAAQP